MNNSFIKKVIHSGRDLIWRNGRRININIPFPMINKRIKGVLTDTINEQCWIKLEHER